MSNEHSCFYAAIGLTSQGDCHSLTQHMLELILSFTFIERAVIFEAYERGRGDDGLPQLAFRRFTDNLSDERAQDNEPGLVVCVINKLPVEVPLAGRRTIQGRFVWWRWMARRFHLKSACCCLIW